MRLLAVLLLAVTACDDHGHADIDDSRRQAAAALAEWNGPCADTAVLVTAIPGYTSEHTCTNKRHHMHVQVQVASAPSREGFGAVVFCECEREGATAPPPADAGAK